MTAWLRRRGDAVHHTRVGRWLRPMGLAAMSPKPRLSQPAAGHVLYPYLLRGITVNRVNQVWSADSTDVRLAGGLMYLVAVMDWFSRDCAVLGRVDHAGCGVLSGGAGPRVEPEPARDLQDRSGSPVHESGLDRAAQARRHSHQYGWPRAGPGPCLCGTVVAECRI